MQTKQKHKKWLFIATNDLTLKISKNLQDLYKIYPNLYKFYPFKALKTVMVFAYS